MPDEPEVVRPEDVPAAPGFEPPATCGYVRDSYVRHRGARRARWTAGFVSAGAAGVSALQFVSPRRPPVRLHRIRNDQLYHRYLGDAFEVLLLYPDRTHRVELMGTRIASVSGYGCSFRVEPSTRPGWSELGRGFSVPARRGRVSSRLMSSLEIPQRWRGAFRPRRTSFADLMSGQQLSQNTASREIPIHQR